MFCQETTFETFFVSSLPAQGRLYFLRNRHQRLEPDLEGYTAAGRLKSPLIFIVFFCTMNPSSHIPA
jgi:hypothetical protein